MSVRCSQTGCPGSYVDGYCDFCGFPEPSGGAPTSFTVPTATAASTAEAEAGLYPPDVAATPTGSVAAPEPSRRTAGAMPAERAEVVVPHVARRRGASSVAALGTARGTGSTRRVGPRRTRRSRLGAGLTSVPTVPVGDPADAVMSSPIVPEDKRFCPSCGAPVGRSHGDEPGRAQGYCPKCRNPFSFTPKLGPGDLVAGQYDVVGALAHGGLGWVYLARDRNVSDRWVVLKGLLNAGDADALAAAVAEQGFLARVEHPLIVEVYNIVTHEGAAYTVMEYVGGTSLKELLKQRMAAAGGTYDPLPIDHALAFVLEILPAFSYLHDLGLLYCDFKPDNLIQVGDGVKLIDLGGMRRLDDLDSPIYGTVGYQAPEIAELGPSIASDIYTIGRTLAVLTTEFRGYQTRYATSLPPASQVPAFTASDPFYRLVAKACALDPADRFQSIEELRTQMLGVLRQVVSDRRGAGAAAQSASSYLFEVPLVTGDTFGWWELPALKPDDFDPMIGWLQTLPDHDSDQRLAQLAEAPERTTEVYLEHMRTALRAGRDDVVAGVGDELLAYDPWEWRALWLLGLDALSRDDLQRAQESFAAVYAQVPGEIAARLALALTAELAGQAQAAEASYLTCLRSDAAYVTAAAFGLARIRVGRGDVRGAVTALDLVPLTSGAHPRARWLRAELSTRNGGGLAAQDAALREMRTLDADPLQRARFTVRVLEDTRAEVARLGDQPDMRVGGVPATEDGVRGALDEAYRALARQTIDDHERIALIDKANEVRRWTLI